MPEVVLPESFDFSKEIEPTEWLVSGLIPLGQLVVCLARSGHGKSYLCESLAVKVICGEQFLGRDVVGGDVLIIDQDTPTQSLESRLVKFGSVNCKPKHKLWVKSYEGLSFSGGTVVQCIESHPSAKLVILDTYHSMLGNFNPNSTSESNYALSTIKSRCVTKDRTVWVNHHLTEKNVLGMGDLMFEDIMGLAMGNSAIIQRADSVFVIYANIEGGELKEMCIRPWGKRAYIEQKPFVASFINFEFSYIGDILGDSDECVNDLRILFYERPNEGFKVEDIYKEVGKKHGINKIYKYLGILEKNNEVRMERGKSNQFKYFSNLDGSKPFVIVKSWAAASEKTEEKGEK